MEVVLVAVIRNATSLLKTGGCVEELQLDFAF